ncbi:MAG: amidohydrolase family protein [Gemmatimonadaceae bacterium]
MMRVVFGKTAVTVTSATALLALAGAPLQAQAGTRRGPAVRTTVIDSVTVVDVANRRLVPDQRIVIRGDSIVAVQSISSVFTDSVDQHISGRGAFAIPGLVDHHVHLTERMAPQLVRAARGGVTMVQALAGDNRVAGEYARMVIAKELAGPEISYASVMAGPGFFTDPRFIGAGLGYKPGTAPWAQAVTENTDVVVAVAAARGSGAEVLKLYAMIDSGLAARLIAEAHRQGMTVVAHGTVFPARPLQLVQAHVDILTHAPYLSWQGATSVRAEDSFNRAKGPYDSVPTNGPAITSLIQEMKRAGTALEPTLVVFARQTTEKAMNEWAASLTAKAKAAGIPIIAGTDGLIDGDTTSLPNIHKELQLLVAAGLTPAEALASATTAPARAMNRAKTHGAVAAGFVADIVLLDANPLQDIAATRQIRQVVLKGRTIRN